MKQANAANERNYSLDVLRIIIMNMVIIHHYQQFTGASFKYFDLYYEDLVYVGHIIQFLFVMSGYFTYKYVKEIRWGEMDFKSFMLPKAIRLLPMVAITTLVLQLNFCIYYLLYDGGAFGSIEHVGDAVSLWRFLISALGIENGWVIKTDIGFATWYVSVLMLCYVIFYLITFIAKRLNVSPVYMYASMILVGIAINTCGIEAPFFQESTARGYYSFFFGLLFAKYMREGKMHTWVKAGSVAVVLGIILSFFSSFTRKIVVGYGYEEAYILTFLFFPALMIIMDFQWVRKLFRFKFIGILGESSFDVYVWHMPVLVLLFNLLKLGGLSINILSAGSMIGFVVVMWIIGIVSYFFLEKRIRNHLFAKLGNSSGK